MKILRSKDEWCFVSLTEEYFKRLKRIRSRKDSPVIPKILKRKTKELSVFPNRVATDNSCRKEFYAALERIGVESSKFGLHSAKIGGVVHLRNSGVSWRDINDYVGWAKDSAMPERYAKAACNESDKLDNILEL